MEKKILSNEEKKKFIPNIVIDNRDLERYFEHYANDKNLKFILEWLKKDFLKKQLANMLELLQLLWENIFMEL